MPERQTLNPQRNGHKFNANALTLNDFRRIEQSAGLSLSADLSGNHPSPLLGRPGIEIICQENTIGVIRPRTIFKIVGQQELIVWENPGVEIGDSSVIFTNFDPLELGSRIIITSDSVELFIKERE